MADPVPIPILALPPATLPLTGAEVLPMVQNGVTAQGTTADMPFKGPSLVSVVRTAYEKMSDFISVKDFGAVGDGATDDTAAIQNALNYMGALGGGTVYFPPGQYVHALVNVDYDNTIIQGAGSKSGGTVLLYPTSTNGIVIRALNGCGVRNLKMAPDGTATNGAAISCLAQDAFSPQNRLQFDSLVLEGCWIGLAVWPNANGAQVTRCNFVNCSQIAMLAGNISPGTVSNFLIQGNAFSGPLAGGAVQLRLDTATGCRVVGNRFTGDAFHIALAPQAPTTNTGGLTISGNTFQDWNSISIRIVETGVVKINDVAITGNSMANTRLAANSGIYIDTPSQGGHIAVTGNVIRLTGTNENGIYVADGNEVTVVGNAIQGPGAGLNGVRIGPVTNNVIVASNSIAGFGTPVLNDSAGNGVLVSGNVTDYGVFNVNPSGNICQLPDWGMLINVQGSNSFNTVNTPNQVGRQVVLKFETGGSTVSASSNLKIGANFGPTTSNDTLTLICDGSRWYEVARSVNAA